MERDSATTSQALIAGNREGIAPILHWADLLASAGLGWMAFVFAATSEWGSAAWALATVASTLLLLRSLAFLHEIAHHGRCFPRLETVWNLSIGFPLGVPSLMYTETHLEHHRPDTYATRLDPEYAPIAEWSRWRVIGFVLGGFAVPLMLTARWLVISPLSWLCPAIHRWAIARASTLAINRDYVRPLPSEKGRRRWIRQEGATLGVLGTGLFCATLGFIPLQSLVQWILSVGAIFFFNQIRTLAAHRYSSYERQTTQLADSINLVASPLHALIAPLGLRYHALHHWHPAIPYYRLGRVHREARRRSDDLYEQVSGISLSGAIRDLMGYTR